MFAIAPPIEPMLAKIAEELPSSPEFLFEPKWDGFRAIVFRGASDVFIQSRDLRPLDRYFPNCTIRCSSGCLRGCVIDGEIVIAGPSMASTSTRCSCGCIRQRRALPSWRRKLRHRLSRSMCSRSMARNVMSATQSERRALLEEALSQSRARRALDPDDAGSRRRTAVARAFRRRRSGRRHRKTGATLPTRLASAC